jgi:pimeloyl-ACP methyl ester carboxylesterase
MRSFALALLAIPLVLPAAARAFPPGQGIALSPCQLGHPIAAARVAARCGTLEVPEDHARPDGRKIGLRVAVIPSDNPSGQPAPVFMLAGGPRQAITEVYPRIAPAFERIGRERDIVLVDQRGTGGSNGLTCPNLSGRDRDEDLLPSEARRLAADCARTLSQKADLTRYGTNDFVRDLEAVRVALGYPALNVMGGSYGTRAALAYARAYPDRTRTLVLDGVAPFPMIVGNDFDRDSQRSLDLLFRRCAGEPACAARYPDLPGDVRTLLARLDARPEKVRLRHPLTGEPIVQDFTGDAARQVLFAFLYQAETSALLPALLREAKGGDLAPLAAQGILAVADIQAGMSRALQLSVLCSEDVPNFVDPLPGASPTFLGNRAREAFRSLCADWPRAAPDPGFHESTRLDVPALLLSGEADPVTPPRWGDVAASSLPAGRHVVVAGAGHGVLGRGCIPRVVAAFVKKGSAEGLDVSCVDRLRPSPIFVDLQGGAP